MPAKRFFLTTSIPYVNARPHLGHALEFVQADTYARFQKLLGNEVFLLTGSDDNALKNVQAAEAAHMPVARYVTEHSALFKKLNENLNVSFDHFVSTSAEERHRRGAQKLWTRIRPEDIDRKKYHGFYCVGCEEFKTEKELVQGECPEHPGKKLEEVEEENYFFKLSHYQGKLLELIENDTLRITPTSRKNEMLAFVRGGLEDFSISRSFQRAHGWGVPVPGDETQVMYVWFDALGNYITALDYADDGNLFKKWWADNTSNKKHFIGKGINRFHTLYWPAMLLSAGLSLPTEVVVHGYITSGGQKMSKSLGNVADPEELIREYGTDAVRYFLLRHVHPFEDSDFTVERFKEAYNANLANGLGNFVSRVMKMSSEHLSKPLDIGFYDLANNTTQGGSLEIMRSHVEKYEFNSAIDTIWKEITVLDKLIQENKPFEIIKTDSQKGKEEILNLVQRLWRIATMLEPFMPETSKKIKEAIKENKKPETLFPRKE
ncbi:MAG TPA: methionine--tRNA ligase [Candidatus Paceibacterota bacterium]